MAVFLYSHVFPVDGFTSSDRLYYPIFIKPRVPFPVEDMRRVVQDPSGRPRVEIIPATVVADLILGECGNMGVVRLQGDSPTRAEIQESVRKAIRYAAAVLHNHLARHRGAERAGLTPPEPTETVLIAGRFLLDEGINVADLGIPPGILEVIVGRSAVIPASEVANEDAEPQKRQRKTIPVESDPFQPLE